MGARVEAAFRRRFGVGDPPARDDHQLLRIAGTELVAPALVGGLTQRGRRRSGGCGSAHRLRAGPRRWPPARCPEPPGPAARSRRTPSPPASARRRAPPPRRATVRRHRGRPHGARHPGRRPAGRGRCTSSPWSRCRACAADARLSAWAAGRSTSNQRTAPPPKRSPRPSSPAPRSTTCAVPRPSARATSASITWVRRRQCGRPADGDAHPARNGAVEAALRLDVAAGRGRARAVQSEPLCRDPARLQRGASVVVAHQRCGVRR